MDIAYQVHIAGFEQSKFLDVNKEKEIEELRIRFVADYSKDAINDMEIDDYINGKYGELIIRLKIIKMRLVWCLWRIGLELVWRRYKNDRCFMGT